MQIRIFARGRAVLFPALFFWALMASPAWADVAIPNAGFETPVLGNSVFQYAPSGGGWTFDSNAGISGNGSGFTAANPNAPQGVQVAFIQGTGRIAQRLSGFYAGITNTLRFQAAQRNYGQPGQTWRVLLDNTVLASFSPPQSATSYADYSVTFTTSTGDHDLVFQGSNLNGGDNTVFIDNVRLTAPLPAPRVAIRQQSNQITVHCDTVPGQTYRVEYKTNLTSAEWERLHGQDFPAGNATNIMVNDSPDQEQRFYRIAAGVTPWLPKAWSSQDIGAVGLAGAINWSNGTFIVQASGADIWNQADGFYYASQSWTGNVEIIARVTALQPTDAWAKAGVMVRETLAANSRHAMMAVTPGYGTSFQRRTATAGASQHTTPEDGFAPPCWVRLVRNGNTLSGYKSTNGTNWVFVGSDTIVMGNPVRVGLAVTAHNDSALMTAAFDQVIIRVPAAVLEDYDGHPFVTNAAPVLAFQRKLAPTLTGIDYTFPEQTAHGVALLTRFPPFTLSDRRIHVDGPWYNSDAANVHFTRGIATVGAIPRYREDDNHPTTLRKAPQNQKWALLTDPVWYGHAANLANQLEAQNPADTRISALRALGVQHYLTNNEAAYRELGRYLFQRERWSMDINGHFVGYPAIDIEVVTGGWEHQRHAMGWLYQGMAQGASEIGLSIVPMLYGQWQFSVGTVHESMRQGGTGNPEYLLPEKDFLAAPDPTLVACQQNNGILSMDGYQQAMWGREPFYKRNTNGSLILASGLPVYNDITNTTAYGWNLYLEPGEARHCLENLYRAATRMYLQHHRRAGQYPATSALRKSFLTNCRIGAWSRYSNEGVQGIQQNDRPLPDWLLDMLIGMYLFTADDITLWSSDMNFIPAALGGNYTAAWRFNAHGALESVVKAAHRYSAHDPLHASSNTFQWCWFNLPMINKNETAGDRYFEKPVAMGKLRPFEGHTYLEMFVAWPALDSTAKTLKVWIDKDGQRSNAYTIQLAHGRTYFYDAWQLPDTFTNLEGKHIWLRTTDLLGTQRTWRGDWREAVNNSVATPPDYQ